MADCGAARKCVNVFYGSELTANVCLPCDATSDEYAEPQPDDEDDDQVDADEEEDDEVMWFGGMDVDYQPATCTDGYIDPTIDSTPSASTTSTSDTTTDDSTSPTTSDNEDEDEDGDEDEKEDAVPDASPEQDDDNPICIAAHLLSHLPAHDLVFSRHRRAFVLCDGRHRCATPGHMVVYEPHGAMMMSTYCARHVARGACDKRVMLVNSPRMRRGVRVLSEDIAHTPRKQRLDGEGEGEETKERAMLQFTALAARYGTRLEERALALVIRMWA